MITKTRPWHVFDPFVPLLDKLTLDECMFVIAAAITYGVLRIQGRVPRRSNEVY